MQQTPTYTYSPLQYLTETVEYRLEVLLMHPILGESQIDTGALSEDWNAYCHRYQAMAATTGQQDRHNVEEERHRCPYSTKHSVVRFDHVLDSTKSQFHATSA